MHQGSLGLRLGKQKGPTAVRLSGPCGGGQELPPCEPSPRLTSQDTCQPGSLGSLVTVGGGGGLSAQPGHTERLTSAHIHAAHWTPVRQTQE